MGPVSYKSAVWGLHQLLATYALCNPHAAFAVESPDGSMGAIDLPATDPGWLAQKWSPTAPTSPHWYTDDQFRGLIAAYLSKDRQTGRVRTVRELVAEFAGLSGTAKQRAIAEATGLGRARLDDLLDGDGVARTAAGALLAAMRRESRPIKPEALGALGPAHIRARLGSFNVVPESVEYKKATGSREGRPFVLETAFGVLTGEYEALGRTVLAGINWSPALGVPFQQLNALVGAQRIDRDDPVVLFVHLAQPGVQFTDRGKGQADV
jgi:hypothetical protein